jgi:hypothetical protein
MKKIKGVTLIYFILKIILISFLFSSNDSLNVSTSTLNGSSPHVSLILHESLINDFFSNIGKIKGKNSNAMFEYEWSLLNPRIEIYDGEALFFAEVNAKTDMFSITRDVKGSVLVVYNEDEDFIEVSIDKADVILDVNLFGNNVLLGEIDIAKYFTKSFTFEGIKPFDNEINFALPNTKERKIKVKTKKYDLILLENIIQLNAEFIFEEIR